jgi:hypothetical protein
VVARADQKEQKPSALIGVNTNKAEAKKVKEVMDREQLNWRSFVSQESTAVEWNNPGMPMYYLIDHRGVIRYKWFDYPGKKSLNAALEELIQEAEWNGRDAPK